MYGGNCCNTFQLILPHGPSRISFLSFFFLISSDLFTLASRSWCVPISGKSKVCSDWTNKMKNWARSDLTPPVSSSWALLLSSTSSATPAGITTREKVKVTSYWVKAPSFLLSQITPPRHIKDNPIELIFCIFVRPKSYPGHLGDQGY